MACCLTATSHYLNQYFHNFKAAPMFYSCNYHFIMVVYNMKDMNEMFKNRNMMNLCLWHIDDWYITWYTCNKDYHQVSNIRHTNISTCRRCSNYIFILHSTLGFNILRKDNCKPRRETFKFWNLVRLISEILRYNKSQDKLIFIQHQNCCIISGDWFCTFHISLFLYPKKITIHWNENV